MARRSNVVADGTGFVPPETVPEPNRLMVSATAKRPTFVWVGGGMVVVVYFMAYERNKCVVM